MLNIQNRYYGFAEYPVEFQKAPLDAQIKRGESSQSSFPLLTSIAKKISQIFHRIIKFFANFLSKEGEPEESLQKKYRVPPSTWNLDVEIQAQQINTVRVGEWTKDNSILVTKGAAETTQWKLDLIQSANHSIEISGTYAGGQVFRDALKAIEERIKARPALQVHILIVPDLLEREDQKLLKHLAKQYPNNFHCLQSHFQFNRQGYRIENHVKLVVVDEKYYVIGGTNYQDNLTREADSKAKPRSIVDKFMGSGSLDMDVVGRGGPLASVMRREFFKLYAILEYKEKKSTQLINHYRPIPQEELAIAKSFEEDANLDHEVRIKAVTGCPDAPINGCTQEYVRLIEKIGKATEGVITFAHMYFHPPQPIKEAIEKNMAKVRFNVITTGLQSGAPIGAWMHGIANIGLASLMKNSNSQTSAYFFDQGGNIYHKKVGVFQPNIDNKLPYVIMGSYNLGGKSRNDYEKLIVIKNKKVADKVLKILENDQTQCAELTEEEAKEYTPSSFKGVIARLQSQLYPVLMG